MASAEKIMIQRCVNYEGKGLINKCTIDSEMTVINSKGVEVSEVVHNGQKYIPCNIGDTIICYYSKKRYSRNFKVVSIDRTEQFYVCDIVYSMEENIELQILELANQVEAGKITPNVAHLKADDLIMSLLYDKGFERIADAFVKLPKFYD